MTIIERQVEFHLSLLVIGSKMIYYYITVRVVSALK